MARDGYQSAESSSARRYGTTEYLSTPSGLCWSAAATNQCLSNRVAYPTDFRGPAEGKICRRTRLKVNVAEGGKHGGGAKLKRLCRSQSRSKCSSAILSRKRQSPKSCKNT